MHPPQPIPLNKAAGRIEALRSAHFDARGIESSHGVEHEARHPSFLVECNLRNHGETTPDFLSEERPEFWSRRPRFQTLKVSGSVKDAR